MLKPFRIVESNLPSAFPNYPLDLAEAQHPLQRPLLTLHTTRNGDGKFQRWKK
jgi:hypothetical protein